MRIATGAVLDRYEVTGLLGEGGMAVVYTVRHRTLGSEHVLKVLTAQGASLAQRLVEEGRVQATLKHPNIVEVTDVIEVHGAPGLVMEFVRGPSLDRLLGHERLPLPLVDALAARLLAGMAAAHAAGFIHRDLKPANVLVASHRGQLVPKIADFGLVKRLDAAEARTRTGTTMGTPQYMSPEQIKDARHLDARTDVFALGAILYELVTGERAFGGESVFEVFQRVTARSYASAETLRPEVPPRMVAAIRAALADLADRPADCAALWKIWSDGASTLDEAAARPVEWPPALLARVTALAPRSVPTSPPTEPPTGPPAGPAAPATRRPVRSLWLAAPLLVGVPALGLLLAAMGIGGAGAAWYLRPVTPEVAGASSGAGKPPGSSPEALEEPAGASQGSVEAPSPAVVPADQATDGAVPASEPPEGATKPPDPPTEAPAPPPGPRTTPAKPPKPPPPPESGRVDVVVRGTATVVLRGGGAERAPGEVPPGDYALVLRAPGVPDATAGKVTVSAGATVRFVCTAELRSCSRQ